MTTIPRIPRGYSGPTFFSYGFRPFFLAGSAWAAISVLIWIPQFFGELRLSTVFVPRDWHIHEMMYGYLAAVVAGFLLTAFPIEPAVCRSRGCRLRSCLRSGSLAVPRSLFRHLRERSRRRSSTWRSLLH